VFNKVQTWNYGTLPTLDVLGSALKTATNNAGALAISPIPTVKIDYTQLDTLDQTIRRQGVSFKGLNVPTEVRAFLKDLPQDTSAPLESSRNSGLVGSAIGTDFIRWMYEHHPQQATTLQLGNTDGARTLVGAFNLSQPNNNQVGLNFNGFAWIPSSLSEIDTLRETKQAPREMQQLIQLFGDYLSQKTNSSVVTTLPKELYIRDFGRQFATSHDITYQDTFNSQITPITFASFNYANDYRGQYPTDVMKGMSTAEPDYKVIKPTLQLSTDQGVHQEVNNLLGVSQSIGTTPGADGAFRIQQNLSYLSEMLGLRTQLAIERGVPVSRISAEDVHKALTQQGWKPYASTPIANNTYASKAIATDNLTQQKH
ncbi:MAG: FAD-dependent oxidoreductase, partial [Vampirovibrionales bacterium]